MPPQVKTENNVTEILEYAIGSPASQIGRRLKSEAELDDLLKVGRWRVRKSIDELERKGILVRRHGSGTYVQRIPDSSTLDAVSTGAFQETLPPENLFTEPAQGSVRSEILRNGVVHQRYTIGLWSDLHCTSSLNQRILADIVKAIAEAGHTLTVHSVVAGVDQPYSINKLTNLLRESPCDGYLCYYRWADVFLQALGLQSKPVLFFYLSNSTQLDKPVVMVDHVTALRRSIEILAREGYRRIAMFGLRNPGRVDLPDVEAEAYQQALAKADLDYRCVTWVKTPDIAETIATTRKLLDSDHRPDAIYVDDDYVMIGIAEALKIADLKPGRDIGLITLANTNHNLPKNCQWSQMRVDLTDFVGLTVDNILRSIESKRSANSAMSLIPTWIPGQTHQKPT